MAEEELYCTCRQPADDRFMIACDKCEEWYHGECIGVLESESANIKYYYCAKCRQLDPSLRTRYRKQKDKKDKKYDKEKKKEKRFLSFSPERKELKKESKKRRVTLYKSSEDEDYSLPTAEKSKSDAKKKNTLVPGDIFGDSDDGDDSFEAFLSNEKKIKKEPKQASEVPAQLQSLPPNLNISAESDEIITKRSQKKKHRDSTKTETGEQPCCLGPKCVNPSRKKSKYCSDKCGRAVAAIQIKFLLPKIEMMKEHPSVATIEQYYRLENLKLQYQTILELRNDLEKKFTKLEEVIAYTKKKSILPHDTQDEPSSEDPMIFCFVCGHLRPSKTLVEHIDKCYRRIEAETSYGSIQETKIEGSQRLFCDLYNNNTKLFCKRLKVMCAEHSKDPKPDENEVCGCPISPDNFYEEELCNIVSCRTAKKHCRKHFLWEKMYRAEIDLKRIRAFTKLEQNLEERKKLENAINNRLGAALVLLNNTVRHTDAYDLRDDERKKSTMDIEEKLNVDDQLLDVISIDNKH